MIGMKNECLNQDCLSVSYKFDPTSFLVVPILNRNYQESGLVTIEDCLKPMFRIKENNE